MVISFKYFKTDVKIFICRPAGDRKNQKCHAIVREFYFYPNVREMSRNFVSDCYIYGKGTQCFLSNPDKIAYTSMYIVMGYVCPLLFTQPEFVFDWLLYGPQMLLSLEDVTLSGV